MLHPAALQRSSAMVKILLSPFQTRLSGLWQQSSPSAACVLPPATLPRCLPLVMIQLIPSRHSSC